MRNCKSSMRVLCGVAAGALGLSLVEVHASQQVPPPAVPTGSSAAPSAAPAPLPPSADYMIGPDDVLTIQFWRDKDVSGDVVVRPDGKISLPLINDVQAAGLTVEQLRLSLVEARKQFEEGPTVFVQVKQINSRKVFIVGSIAKPGIYQLSEPMTVIQLISKAGGLTEYADKKHILVVRVSRPSGEHTSFNLNYKDYWDPKKLKQDIDLQVGDTVVIK